MKKLVVIIMTFSLIACNKHVIRTKDLSDSRIIPIEVSKRVADHYKIGDTITLERPNSNSTWSISANDVVKNTPLRKKVVIDTIFELSKDNHKLK